MFKWRFGVSLILCIWFFAIGADSMESGGPLSLRSAIDIGLKNNPKIIESRSKIKASDGIFWNAISPSPPEISVTNDDIPVDQAVTQYGVQTIGVSQTVEFPTNYAVRGLKQSKERAIAEYELMQTEIDIISNIKKSYFTVLAEQVQYAIAQENCTIAGDFAVKSEVRHSVGEGSNLELMTAKITYTEALSNVQTRKSHLAIAFTELNHALGNGKNDSKAFLLTDTLSFLPMGVSPDRLADDAASTNPRLKTGNLQVEIRSNEQILAWSAILPNFNIGWFNKQIKGEEQRYYGASIGIEVPLWFLLDHRGKIQEAAANTAIAKSNLRTAGNEVYLNAKTALAEFEHEEKQVQLYRQDILPVAEEIFRTAKKSYEAGEITYLEFLQAQQTLKNSKSAYTDALLAYNLSIVAIEESIGKTFQ